MLEKKEIGNNAGINNQINKTMKKQFLFLMMAFTLMLSSCNDLGNTTDKKLMEKQEQLMDEANKQAGMPAIKNFQERKLMKMILELRDQSDLVCYAYVVPEMTGKPVFLGMCIGYGLPYSTQYTNPERLCSALETHETHGTGNISLPQADPNGLFMPQSAAGTWLMMIDPETNEPSPVYCEPNILVSPFKLAQ